MERWVRRGSGSGGGAAAAVEPHVRRGTAPATLVVVRGERTYFVVNHVERVADELRGELAAPPSSGAAA